MIPAHSSGREFRVAEPVRQRVRERVGDDHVLGVAAVIVPSGVDGRGTQILPAAAAVPARPVGPAEPGRPDPVTGLEPGHTGTRLDDLGHHLMAGRHVRRLRRQVTLGEVQVGPADATAADLHEQLAGTGLGNRPVDQPQRARVHRPGLVHHPCAHAPTLRAGAAVTGGVPAISALASPPTG